MKIEHLVGHMKHILKNTRFDKKFILFSTKKMSEKFESNKSYKILIYFIFD